MDTTYTKVGGDLLNWQPLRARSIVARWLWVALYVSPRRVLPGLFMAGLPTIADTAKMTPDDTLAGLDELLEHDLIEYDRDREVLRLTELPDRCERPNNGRHIRALWTRFRGVPQCQVRDAHIRLLEWLLNDPSKPPTEDHVDAWRQTFGTVAVPSPRRRGVRRLLDSDTSTTVQPGLFTKPTETVTVTTGPIPYPIPYTDTHRSTIGDLGSSSSGSGQSTVRAIEAEPEQIPLRPALALVPAEASDDLPFSVTAMLEALAEESNGRFAAGPVDARLVDTLRATVRACATAEVGLDDLRMAGRFLASGGLSYRTDLGPVWASKAGNLIDLVGAARAWAARGGGRVAGGPRSSWSRIEPAPPTAFGSGRRVLR